MWFLLRMTFWLGVVLVLLPTGSSQTAPKSPVSAGEAFSAARGAVTDVEHFCERQQEACVVGSRTAVTLGQRAQAGEQRSISFSVDDHGVSHWHSPLPNKPPPTHVTNKPCPRTDIRRPRRTTRAEYNSPTNAQTIPVQ
jgi:hypothetical protein